MNTSRLDLSDPALKEAIANVRSDATPATWCVFTYEGKAKIVCKEVGEGAPYQATDNMDDAEVSYALLRVSGTRDQESKTVKFVFIVYTGPGVGGMARGRVNAHKGDVKEFIGQSHVDISTDDRDDMSEAVITDKLVIEVHSNAELSFADEIVVTLRAKYTEILSKVIQV